MNILKHTKLILMSILLTMIFVFVGNTQVFAAKITAPTKEYPVTSLKVTYIKPTDKSKWKDIGESVSVSDFKVVGKYKGGTIKIDEKDLSIDKDDALLDAYDNVVKIKYTNQASETIEGTCKVQAKKLIKRISVEFLGNKKTNTENLKDAGDEFYGKDFKVVGTRYTGEKVVLDLNKLLEEASSKKEFTESATMSESHASKEANSTKVTIKYTNKAGTDISKTVSCKSLNLIKGIKADLKNRDSFDKTIKDSVSSTDFDVKGITYAGDTVDISSEIKLDDATTVLQKTSNSVKLSYESKIGKVFSKSVRVPAKDKIESIEASSKGTFYTYETINPDKFKVTANWISGKKTTLKKDDYTITQKGGSVLETGVNYYTVLYTGTLGTSGMFYEGTITAEIPKADDVQLIPTHKAVRADIQISLNNFYDYYSIQFSSPAKEHPILIDKNTINSIEVKELLAQFGEPEITVGGTVLRGSTVFTVQQTAPKVQVKFMGKTKSDTMDYNTYVQSIRVIPIKSYKDSSGRGYYNNSTSSKTIYTSSTKKGNDLGLSIRRFDKTVVSSAKTIGNMIKVEVRLSNGKSVTYKFLNDSYDRASEGFNIVSKSGNTFGIVVNNALNSKGEEIGTIDGCSFSTENLKVSSVTITSVSTKKASHSYASDEITVSVKTEDGIEKKAKLSEFKNYGYTIKFESDKKLPKKGKTLGLKVSVGGKTSKTYSVKAE